MATFDTISSPGYKFKNTTFIKTDGKFTDEDISRINSIQKPFILVVPNTKYLSPTQLRKITNPNVQISVVGGLDYLRKKKFNQDHYIERTLFTPNTLASVVEAFEKIESKIRYTWTDRQKCMFVYKTLVEQLHYKYNHETGYENRKDVVRSLDGLLYGKLVCSGFALVFKEAMDRLGIPCLYQNRQNSHSWNLVQLGGKIYGMELTWDCFHKGADNICEFRYFGRNKDFYKNYHHDISEESEERVYPIEAFSDEELKKDYRIISYGKNIEKRKMTKLPDSNGQIYYIFLGKNVDKNVSTYMVSVMGDIHIIYTDKDPDHLLSIDVYHAVGNGGFDTTIPVANSKYQLYERKDGSRFYIRKKQDISPTMGEYTYLDITYKDGEPVARRGILLSEMDLAAYRDKEQKALIADCLLSKERLKRKMNATHGYVGYMVGRQMYYDRKFEEENLHLVEHVSSLT